MNVSSITPILNVSDMGASFAWFESLGWRKLWDWGTPPTFGGVGSGQVEIFLCYGAQGSRGGPAPKSTGDDETGGVWMSWWVESPAEVDRIHDRAVKLKFDIPHPPTDEPWCVREFHLRHPDGHTFRVSAGLGKE